LKKSPIIAVIIISLPNTSYGSIILSIASNSSHIVRVSKKMTEIIVPIISALYHPQVCPLDAGLMVILRATIDIIKPIISEAKCAVSVKMAIEFAKYPPMH